MIGRGAAAERHSTVVNHDTWSTELRFDGREDLLHRVRVAKVTANVQLAGSAVFLLQAASSEGNPVALGCKCAANMLPDVGASSKDEGDGRVGSHLEIVLG